MDGVGFSTLLLGVLGLILVAAGIEDVRHREIAHWKNGLIALLAPLWWVASGLSPWPDMAMQFGLGLAVLAFFSIIFHIGMMGGGDVKLLAALALWFPWEQLIFLLVIMSLVGGVITVAMLLEKLVRRSRALIEVPYGVAIVCAALTVMREPLFNQFG